MLWKTVRKVERKRKKERVGQAEINRRKIERWKPLGMSSEEASGKEREKRIGKAVGKRRRRQILKGMGKD
jgi:hypothetical protein